MAPSEKIAFPEKCLKKKIWEIVKSHRPINTEYVVDHLAKSAGHEVVRLSVAHCELNPIEMAWAEMKNYIKKNNIKFTLSEIETDSYRIHYGFTRSLEISNHSSPTKSGEPLLGG